MQLLATVLIFLMSLLLGIVFSIGLTLSTDLDSIPGVQNTTNQDELDKIFEKWFMKHLIIYSIIAFIIFEIMLLILGNVLFK